MDISAEKAVINNVFAVIEFTDAPSRLLPRCDAIQVGSNRLFLFSRASYQTNANSVCANGKFTSKRQLQAVANLFFPLAFRRISKLKTFIIMQACGTGV